jgi:hypothetical protein
MARNNNAGAGNDNANQSDTKNAQDDLALLVRGQQMGIPKDLDGKVFCNFRSTFKVRFKNGGSRAAWVLRAQPDKAGGYLFELVQEGADLYLYGWVYDGRKKAETLGSKQKIPFGQLRETKALFIDVEVKDNVFSYEITFEDDQPDEDSNVGQKVNAEFKDNPSKVRWPCGAVGFMVTDDVSVMRVESIYVYPHPLPQSP